MPPKNRVRNSRFSYALKKYILCQIVFLFSVMPRKDLAFFLIYTPQKPSFNDKV